MLVAVLFAPYDSTALSLEQLSSFIDDMCFLLCFLKMSAVI